MANSRVNNVIFVDTTGYTFSGPLYIESIKFIGATGATAAITAGTSGTGAPLYEAAGTASVAEEVCIAAKDGLHVAVASGAKLYIYLE